MNRYEKIPEGMKTIADICEVLHIKKGSRNNYVKKFSEKLNINGELVFIGNKSFRVLLYTQEQFNTIIEKIPVVKHKTYSKRVLKKTTKYEYKKRSEQTATTKNENRAIGYYNAVQPLFMINAFQGEICV